MATYADWSASRQSASGQHTPTASDPVKLVIDSQGNVIRDAQLPVMSSQVDSGMMEEVRMSLDDQLAIVHNIRQQHRDSNSKAGMHEHATTLSEDQRAWNNKAIPPSTILLVIDTNWLLSHLKLFAQLERLIPHNDISFAPVLFILPSLVLSELNGLKNADAPQHDGLYSRHTPTVGSLARNASNFILDKLTHRPDLFRGQKAGEAGIQGAVQALKTNDELILDCCAYFQKQGYQVGLLSDDRILCAQATVAGLPYVNFTPEDNDAQAFLAKLNPDLPPYFAKLRAGQSGVAMSTNAAIPAPDLSLEAFADKTVQMQQNLLEQQMSAISHLEHNFPLMPPELLEVISVVTNTLLVPVIFPVLLHHMANDNLEIFAYLLKRSSIFKGFPFSDQSARDEEILDCTRWNAAICLRLIDQNWQMCFVDRAGKITASNETTNSTSNPSSSTFSSPDRWKTSYATPSTPATTGSSLSSSRWAKAGTSSPSSNFTSSRRNYSPSSHSTASTNALFHPSKIAALAKSFTPSDEDVLRWSPARWRLVLEDLELFLCRTSILADVPDGKQKAELLLKAARKNVDAWKAA